MIVLRILKYLFALVLALGVVGAGVLGLALWHFSRDLPDHSQLAAYQPAVVTRVHAGDGRLMAEYATERRVSKPAAGPLVPIEIDLRVYRAHEIEGELDPYLESVKDALEQLRDYDIHL